MFSFFRKTENAAPVPPIGPDTVRRHFVFHGRVQGVGFRFQAVISARNLGVTGWVRNEYDGTVEMEAQGTREQLGALIETLQSQRYIRIESIDTVTLPLRTDETAFRERY